MSRSPTGESARQGPSGGAPAPLQAPGAAGRMMGRYQPTNLAKVGLTLSDS